jgi:NitT/TauT family transport system ATP-binding protein
MTIGFIPLVDAASLLVAADFGFAEVEGIDIELKREVSWANIREKLSAGLLDAAHLLAPMAIASSLDLMPGSVALTAPYVLAYNGNAITVSPSLGAGIAAELGSGETAPLATAQSISRIVARRKRDGLAPLTFGTTFPFSSHSYLLRQWLEAGGVDTANDIRLTVLPPPYMVESLKSGEVDGFCVGAPWSSVAEDLRLGSILHFGCEIVHPLTEKVLAARSGWTQANEGSFMALMRAISAAAAFVSEPANWAACCARLAAPDRIGAAPGLVQRALSGTVAANRAGETKTDPRYLILGCGQAARPAKSQAAWFYEQMLRWGQTGGRTGLGDAAQAVFATELADRALGTTA